MKIIVCVKQLPDGTVNPFDASALECALGLRPEHITLLSMGRTGAAAMLEDMTRLGPIDAVLLSDMAFAGADTLATAYTLSQWLKDQEYDYIFCGRQSIDGETAQVGPELANMLGLDLVPLVMKVTKKADASLQCITRNGEMMLDHPAVLTFERSKALRFPSLFAKPGTVTVMDSQMLGVDLKRCGLKGSPTQVLASYENTGGRRNCRMIQPKEFRDILKQALEQPDRSKEVTSVSTATTAKVAQIWITDPILEEAAKELAEEVKLVTLERKKSTVEDEKQGEVSWSQVDLDAFLQKVEDEKPQIILFPSDWDSRCIAPQIAAMLQTGLCADCTDLVIEDGELHMIRPAFGGNLVAKIRCSTFPVMATVRTVEKEGERLVFSVGKGAVAHRPAIDKLAEELHGEMASSRACVEAGEFPYEYQVGLTGKNVSPKVYVAFGISGAIHHIVGMERSQTVIAINKDPNAEIFKYADYGICCDVKDIL